MFLSLVRPDRISSPMTKMAAVTIELMAFPFSLARYTASRNRHGKRLMNDVHATAPHRPINFAPARVTRTTDADGTIRLACATPLGAYEPSLARLFRKSVEAQPGRTFLQERAGDQWRKLTYEEARRAVDGLAASLIERGLSADRPVMILSGNSSEHALLMIACFTAGVPVELPDRIMT